MTSEAAERHYSIDTDRMIDRVLEMTAQIRESWDRAAAFCDEVPSGPSRVVISGMGGSAIGGLLLRDLAGDRGGGRIFPHRGYTLPSFAGADTNVVCVSYSGNTEEVLSLFDEALSRGCAVSAVTSGGLLAEKAAGAGAPVMEVPGGLAPRAALGCLLAPLMRLASMWSMMDLDGDSLESALVHTSRILEKCSPTADLSGNTAKMLAKRLYGKIPLIYSGDGLLSGAAYRWKCQFNENSKSMAFCNSFPELGHNEVMAWDCPQKMKESTFLLMLRDGEDHPRVARRMEATWSAIEGMAGGSMLIDSEGPAGPGGRLARLLSIVALGDLTSVYLAVEYGKDPTPIGRIEDIKDTLRTEDG